MERKTLASCSIAEFLPQAYKTREAFHTLYHAVGVDDIRQKAAQALENADEKQREAVIDSFKAALWQKLMRDHVREVLDVVAACAFLTPEEAGALKPAEAMQILTECITDRDVMAFFISAERLAGNSTDGILPVLILLAASALDADTSQTQSQSNTTETAAESSASAISGSA